MRYVFLLGRVLFALLFLVKSLEHFSLRMISHAEGMGVFMAPVLVPFAGVIAFLGGLSLLLGYKTRVGAWLLVLFLLPATFVMHRFWQAEDIFASMMHQYCFLKNLSLLGAALMISYWGPGPFSLDKRS